MGGGVVEVAEVRSHGDDCFSVERGGWVGKVHHLIRVTTSSPQCLEMRYQLSPGDVKVSCQRRVTKLSYDASWFNPVRPEILSY